jgi:hypothetical protein
MLFGLVFAEMTVQDLFAIDLAQWVWFGKLGCGMYSRLLKRTTLAELCTTTSGYDRLLCDKLIDRETAG